MEERSLLPSIKKATRSWGALWRSPGLKAFVFRYSETSALFLLKRSRKTRRLRAEIQIPYGSARKWHRKLRIGVGPGFISTSQVEKQFSHATVSRVMKNVRVRFAPSPTGFLHIGGARTALFNWLYARSQGGKFLLRIEDTDTERSEDRFTDDIKESLRWLGLDWDEEPIFQSKRFDRYRELVEGLIEKGEAYRCECTPQELDAVRAKCVQEKRAFRYPGTCRNKKISRQEGTVVRVKVPSQGETAFKDLIRGEISFSNRDIDDWVVLRTNGAPTYNFSVVVDDSDQKITHVLRGDDHINNTPKQILLYQTLGLEVPHFAHLPMILGTDKAKLSKRHGAASTLEYRKMGYLPEAILCFLVRLGWSHGDQEIFTVDELTRLFSLDHIGKASAVFSPDKLNWVSGQVLGRTSAEHMAGYLKRYFKEEISFVGADDEARFEGGVETILGKVKNVLEMIEQLKCLFDVDPKYDGAALTKHRAEGTAGLLSSVVTVLKASDFTRSDLEAKVKAMADEARVPFPTVAKALRFAVTGGKVSPGLFEMLEAQGRDRVLRRVANLQKALSE